MFPKVKVNISFNNPSNLLTVNDEEPENEKLKFSGVLTKAQERAVLTGKVFFVKNTFPVKTAQELVLGKIIKDNFFGLYYYL